MAAAQIAHALGLPYASIEAAERLTNKVAQRRAMKAEGVPVPGFWPALLGRRRKNWMHSWARSVPGRRETSTGRE